MFLVAGLIFERKNKFRVNLKWVDLNTHLSGTEVCLCVSRRSLRNWDGWLFVQIAKHGSTVVLPVLAFGKRTRNDCDNRKPPYLWLVVVSFMIPSTHRQRKVGRIVGETCYVFVAAGLIFEWCKNQESKWTLFVCLFGYWSYERYMSTHIAILSLREAEFRSLGPASHCLRLHENMSV